jgi:hypothetical protein
MNKHAMYMVLCIGKENMQYYSMLYYALETWEKYYNGDYDVFVSVSSRDFDFWNDEYLGLNIPKRFPNVIYYKSDFDRKKYNVYLQKWYDIDKVFSRGYDSIFQFDIDSIFYGDIRFIFDKYNEDYIYSLIEGYNEHFFKVLGENGIPSGQLIIPKSAIQKVGNVFEKILEKRKEIVEIAKEKLENPARDWFINLSEQYSAQKVFKENGVVYSHLDLRDIGMGIEDFEIICDSKIVQTRLKKYKPAAGYMSANYHLFLPNEYLENKDIKRKLKHCRDNNK